MVHNQIQGLSLSTASYYRTWSICWFPKAPYIWLSNPPKEIVSGKHYLLQRHWRSRDKRDIKLIFDYICLSLIVVHSLPGSLFYLFEQRLSIKSEHFIRFITLSHFQTLYWTLWPGLLPECKVPLSPRLWPPPGLSVTHQASNCLVFNLHWVVTVCWAKYYSTIYEKQKYNIAISFYFSQRIVKVLFLDSVNRFFRLWLELNEWQWLCSITS